MNITLLCLHFVLCSLWSLRTSRRTRRRTIAATTSLCLASVRCVTLSTKTSTSKTSQCRCVFPMLSQLSYQLLYSVNCIPDLLLKTTGRCIFVLKFNVCVCVFRIRVSGIRGLQGVVRKTVDDELQVNIWEPRHMEQIVPALLVNLQRHTQTNRYTHTPTGTHTLNRHCTAIKTLAWSPILSNIYGGLTTWRWV